MDILLVLIVILAVVFTVIVLATPSRQALRTKILPHATDEIEVRHDARTPIDKVSTSLKMTMFPDDADGDPASVEKEKITDLPELSTHTGRPLVEVG